MGWWVARNWRSLASPSMANAPALALTAAAIWVGIQGFTAWSMVIVAPPPPWWAQIKMEADEFPAVFNGSVLRSSIGTVPIEYSDRLENSDIVRTQVLEGAAVKTVVTGALPSAGPAPILSLATHDALAEIVALVQTEGDVFLSHRTMGRGRRASQSGIVSRVCSPLVESRHHHLARATPMADTNRN